MSSNPTPPKRASRARKKAVPLAEIVAANLREILKRDEIGKTELGEKLGRTRQWVHRRATATGPITTDDIDLLAEALGVSTDDLTRRG